MWRGRGCVIRKMLLAPPQSWSEREEGASAAAPAVRPGAGEGPVASPRPPHRKRFPLGPDEGGDAAQTGCSVLPSQPRLPGTQRPSLPAQSKPLPPTAHRGEGHRAPLTTRDRAGRAGGVRGGDRKVSDQPSSCEQTLRPPPLGWRPKPGSVQPSSTMAFYHR